MAGDRGKIKVEEKVVLEKFDGDPADGRLAERITMIDGKIVNHEKFEEVN